MIAVTNYNGVSYTSTSRILESTTYSYEMTVESTEFTETSFGKSSFVYTATVFIALISAFFLF
jgi:hypothetical protein